MRGKKADADILKAVYVQPKNQGHGIQDDLHSVEAAKKKSQQTDTKLAKIHQRCPQRERVPLVEKAFTSKLANSPAKNLGIAAAPTMAALSTQSSRLG